VAAALLPAAGAAWAACSPHARAVAICDSHLRRFDGTDVFALSADEVLGLARALRTTELRLRHGLPSRESAQIRPVRLALRRAAHRGRVYARAYRAQPGDESLPQEAAFENSLRRLGRVARNERLSACSVRLATP
jgi:hypothetical protein